MKKETTDKDSSSSSELGKMEDSQPLDRAMEEAGTLPKRCPCCDSRPRIDQVGDDYQIRCVICGLQSNVDDLYRIIDRWNKRANQTPLDSTEAIKDSYSKDKKDSKPNVKQVGESKEGYLEWEKQMKKKLKQHGHSLEFMWDEDPKDIVEVEAEVVEGRVGYPRGADAVGEGQLEVDPNECRGFGDKACRTPQDCPRLKECMEDLVKMVLKISQDPKTAEEAEKFQKRISTLTVEELFRTYSAKLSTSSCVPTKETESEVGKSED